MKIKKKISTNNRQNYKAIVVLLKATTNNGANFNTNMSAQFHTHVFPSLQD